MAQSEALLKVLNSDEEPLKKRIKIADNAFRSTEFNMQHKEAFLLKWVTDNLANLSKEDAWTLANQWLSSEQFKQLTQNDINNDNISGIVEIFLKHLQDSSETNPIERRQIIDCVQLLCDHKVFQQYFQYNLELYFRFLSATLKKINSPFDFIQFLRRPFLFSKNFSLKKTFHKHFLYILFPDLIRKVLEFGDNQNVFREVSQLVQKCIFNGNSKKFETFFAQCLENQQTKGNIIVLPKTLFKYLNSTYCEPTDTTALSFKIIFHAYSESFDDFDLIFKFFIVVAQLLSFDVKQDFSLNLPLKIRGSLNSINALQIFYVLLDVLSNRNFTDCKISKISFTEFLRKLLKSLLLLGASNFIILKIIHKYILVNPLIIEPIIMFILPYVWDAYSEEVNDLYESVVIGIFDVFAKLHRLENFVAKMVPALKDYLMGGKIDEQVTDIYSFLGETDMGEATKTTAKPAISVSNIFSDNILQTFTNSINGLASWQIINVLKTLLFHVKATVNEYSNNIKQDSNLLNYLEILGTLLTRLLQSARIADHSIPQNVVEKLVIGLQDLYDILKVFGPWILKREHNHITMRTFLNISYIWGETYIILSYYSINNEVQMTTVIDNTYTSCNLRYLHSYLDVKQWQLISQRITNFGEQPCKKLLQKLYIQKLRALLLFEDRFNNDIITNVVKTLQTQADDTWRDLLLDKFAVKFILPKMDKLSLSFLTEHLMEDQSLHEIHHIKDSITLINSITYVAITKINKLFKHKRKHDQDLQKNFSSKIFDLIPAEIFFCNEDYDINEIIENIKILFDNEEEIAPTNIGSREGKVINYLQILKRFPIIYSSMAVQKMVLLYLFSLYGDVLSCTEQVRSQLEDLIIGILQACKFQLSEIFTIETLGTRALKHFQRYDVIFTLMTDNIFKNEKGINQFEPLANNLVKKLADPKYLGCGILVLQAVNKIKKSKMDPTAKETANQYKEKIISKMSKLVCKSDYLIEAYATCLKHYLSLEKDLDTTKKLLDKLGSYIEYSLDNIDSENKRGCVVLFTTVLHNKQKIKDLDENIVLKVWNACKKVEIGEEYSHLVKLIVTLIPNEEFQLLVKDLLGFTENSIYDKNYILLARQLKTWKSILTCHINSIKTKALQEVLEKLVQKLLNLLKYSEYDETLFRNVIHLEESIIQTHHFILSSPLIDMFIITVSVLMNSKNGNFEIHFNLATTLLEKLLKSRNAMIMDRLPPFLQQYRIILNNLCAKSNSDKSSESLDVNKASDCAHKLEKLTKNLSSCKKDMGRIAVFLIADILERYEQINLYPNVKLHLNNCIYSLISVCDHHAVSYLMRVLSTASTEMFKILYEHYKKYYMFTGKV